MVGGRLAELKQIGRIEMSGGGSFGNRNNVRREYMVRE